MIDQALLSRLLPAFMVRQRWFALSDQLDFDVEIVRFEVWRDAWPGLVWAVVEARRAAGEPQAYQVLIGLRPSDDHPEFLSGKEQWLLGEIETTHGLAIAYDALVDPDLAVELFARVAPELAVERVRPLIVEQTNTSIVGDEAYILKMFRRLHNGDNPDVDVANRLWAHGFTHTPEPMASWRQPDVDLAVVRRFVPSSIDGFILASTSLRDLYDSQLDPATSGGDFAPESFRLGVVVAQMHLALAAAYGTSEVARAATVGQVVDELHRIDVPGVASIDVAAWATRAARLLPDRLVTSRVHGDLHLGQLLRSDTGWLVVDFEGEPARPVHDRIEMASPWRDVGAMLRSFDYAAHLTLAERPDEQLDDTLRSLGERWRVRNRGAFLNGYRGAMSDASAVADDELDVLVRFFELAKAVYEVGYERAHRPDLAWIPETAVRTLLDDT